MPDAVMPAPASEAPARESGLSLLGVRIRIHASWLILALLIAWSLASGALPALYEGLPRGAYWTTAVLIVAGLAVSIVLHELAHTLAGRTMGVRVDRITLFLFGGVAELREEPRRPMAELVMALAGPAFSLAFAGLLAALAMLVRQATPAAGANELGMALAYLATLNLVLAAFNLLPAFPLDGGRVLRALIWMGAGDLARATRIAARTGEALAVGLMLAGAALVFTAGVVGGLWWVIIGLFLHGAARGALLDLEARLTFAGHPVAEVMTAPVEAAPAGLTLDRFVEEMLFASRHGLYPVVSGGAWTGVVRPADVLRVPREQWPSTTVGEVCAPATAAPHVGPADDAAQVLQRMQAGRVQRLPVVEQGAVVGMVTHSDLVEAFDLWRRFRRG